jgi:mannosyltransferase
MDLPVLRRASRRAFFFGGSRGSPEFGSVTRSQFDNHTCDTSYDIHGTAEANKADNAHRYLVALLAGLAICLRLPWFNNPPLSLDESFTLWFTNNPWSTFRWNVAEYDLHPPLYYAIVKLFRAMGDREWILRAPSLIFAIASIPFFYLAGRIVGGEKNGRSLGLVVTIFYSVSSIQIAQAQNARSYSFYVLAGAIAFAGLAWIIRHSDRYAVPLLSLLRSRKPLTMAAASAFGLALLPWAHNLGLIFAAVFGLSALGLVLAERRTFNGGVAAIVVTGLIAFVLWSPNVPALILQLSSESHETWIKPISVLVLAKVLLGAFGVLPDTSGPLLIGGIFCSLIFAGAGAIGVIRMWRTERTMAAFCVLAILAPLAGAIIYSLLIQPVLLSRILLPSVLPWSILISYAVIEYPHRNVRLMIASGVALALGFDAGTYFLNPERGEPWVRIVNEISERGERSAVVLTVPNSSGLPLNYYNGRLSAGLIIKPIPGPFPATNKTYEYPSGGVGVPAIDEHMISEMTEILKQNSNRDIWVVLRGYWIYDRQNRIRSILDQNYCYVPIKTGIWYLLVFKLIKKTEAAAGKACGQEWQ